MAGGDSTASELSHADRWLDGADPDGERQCLGLAIGWCLADAGRIGEVVLVPEGRTLAVGRGDEGTARFVRIRPRGRRLTGPLEGRLLSRRQLEVRASGDGLDLVNVGSCTMRVDGVAVREAHLPVGRAVELDRQLVLVAVRRSPMPDLDLDPRFGAADEHGIVGESVAAWELRARLRFLARRSEAVLVTGASGTGKELAARAIHAGSGGGPFVARNAATLPEGLIDAELFGNVKGYPNPGLPERPGLIGAADGGTLFLDEIGEMPAPLQAHLLRVLDQEGEYQRLGEARSRRSRFRFVAATNRDPAELKHDVLARLPLRLDVPGLDARPEDVPLLVRHLLAEVRRDPELAERFFEEDDARIAPELILALIHHPWTHHVRELQALLWLAVETSPGRALVLGPEVRDRLGRPAVEPRSSLDADEVRAALAASDGNVTEAARRLGVSSRYALYRLMRKHGLG